MSEPTILIVEDDLIVARDIQQHLRADGFGRTRHAVSAGEGLAVAREGRPALAVVNIMLDGSPDGLDLTRTLRAELGVKVVIVSGVDNPIDSGAIEAGPDVRFVAKPFSAARLREAVRELLRETGPERAPAD